MLAVGKDNPGTTAQTLHAMSNSWDMRSGKDYKHDVWTDELNDAMASIGLDVRCITDEPLRSRTVYLCALIRISFG